MESKNIRKTYEYVDNEGEEASYYKGLLFANGIIVTSKKVDNKIQIAREW